MSDTPFIKFYPSDFLGGTSGLSPAERGVYITLLCLIYENNGAISRDDARLARRCGALKAAFIRVLDELIEQGKLTGSGGMISNKRAEKAIMDRSNRVEIATIAANKRWAAHEGKTQQNQAPYDAVAMPEQCQKVCQPEPEPDIEEANASSKRNKRGTRLSKDWVLPVEWGEWALSEGWGMDAIERQSMQFKDYWISKAGQSAVKIDWKATWRNWMRNSKDQRHGNGNSNGNPNPTTRAIFVAGRVRRASSGDCF